MRFDSVDQIARHVLTQVRAANNECHGTAALGQEHSRLTCGVATPHDDYRCTRAESSFEWRRGVVDAVTFELFQTIDRQAPVSRRRQAQIAPVNAECACDCGVDEERKLMRALTD